jgi:hypothetical protein
MVLMHQQSGISIILYLYKYIFAQARLDGWTDGELHWGQDAVHAILQQATGTQQSIWWGEDLEKWMQFTSAASTDREPPEAFLAWRRASVTGQWPVDSGRPTPCRDLARRARSGEETPDSLSLEILLRR